jgi:hypothetical protein
MTAPEPSQCLDALNQVRAERDALMAENVRLREAVNAMNCTAALAHALDDGLVWGDSVAAIQAALDAQMKALDALQATP